MSTIHQKPTTTSFRAILFALGGLVLVYSVSVLIYACSSYEIGITSILRPVNIGKPRSERTLESGGGLDTGDKIIRVGDVPIKFWADLLKAPGKIHQQLTEQSATGAAPPPWLTIDPDTQQKFVEVQFERAGQLHRTLCELRRIPLEAMVPSVIWLFLKGALFIVGALVYWKRPNDEAALRFYILCVVTVGAYIGGYHWSLIATQPVMILVFMACAIFLPVASLHFYLVFPRKKLWLELYPGRVLLAVYGIPLINLLGFALFYAYIKWLAPSEDGDQALRQNLPWLMYLSFGLAMLWYVACIVALVHSWRTIQDSMELKQVKCVLFGIVLSMFPIGFSLYVFLATPSAFAEGAVTWPMFLASLVVSLAFAIGMTRYRLMELETIINSSLGYFFVSFLAGLMYYGVVLIGTLFYSHFITQPTFPAAIAVSTTALLFVVALDLARNRFKTVLDRRFSRNKSQLDRTLQQMSQAVSRLVDPPELAQRLLSTLADSLNVQRGAVFLRDEQSSGYRLAASRGEGSWPELPIGSPLAEGLKSGLGLEVAAPAEGAGTAAQQQLRQAGGAIAQPLMHDGALLAVLLLGPRDTPYRAEDWTLLSAFAQITVVALESAAQHRTIEQLHGDLQSKVDKIAEQQRRIMTLQTQLRQTATEKVIHKIEVPVKPPPTVAEEVPPNTTGIIGSSATVHQLLKLVRKVAATDAVVLLRGESGTGKELLARAVHDNSPRAGKPYVKVHCAALSPHLLESELFGHVKGAFTGAHRDKVGRFEMASAGTLFLDEIGDISLDVQTKLLRVLQERTYERVGSSETVPADVRIITATHQNLEELIRKGRFREDLFYRLNVFPIEVPSLRQRPEDIPELALFFVQQASQRCRKTLLHFEDEALSALSRYPWPGNVRELENVIERAVVIAEGDTLTLHDLPAEIIAPRTSSPETDREFVESDAEPGPPRLRARRDEFEREQVLHALSSADGNKSEAARILGVARSTLMSRMKKLGLE
jgi:transcriptional regulator with GAF, ATPase, and Fis domain